MNETAQYTGPGWFRARLKRQVSELVRLAVPIVLQRLGIMGMGLVDTLMVGRYSAQELAYQNIGHIPVMTLIVVTLGLMTGTLVLTSNAYGVGDFKKCGRIWRRSIPYGFALGMVGFVICFFGEPLLLLMGQSADLARGGGVVMQAIAIGIPMTCVMLASSFFLEGINRPLPGMIFMLVANIINIFLNWIFVYGHLGFDAMGAEGSAWATSFVRTLLAVALVVYVLKMRDHKKFGLLDKVDMSWARWKKLRRLGYATGLTNGIEHMGFATLSTFTGWLGAMSAAAFGIAINCYGLPFMAAVGIAGATAVRVGIAYGRKDYRDMVLAGAAGVGVNTLLMLPFMAAMLIWPMEITRLFTHDQDLIVLTAPLVALMSLMMIVDTGQTVIGNALRGRHDVQVPIIFYTFSYLVLMVPLAWYLVFPKGHGTIGVVEAVIVASIVSFLLLSLRFYTLYRRDHIQAH